MVPATMSVGATVTNWLALPGSFIWPTRWHCVVGDDRVGKGFEMVGVQSPGLAQLTADDKVRALGNSEAVERDQSEGARLEPFQKIGGDAIDSGGRCDEQDCVVCEAGLEDIVCLEEAVERGEDCVGRKAAIVLVVENHGRDDSLGGGVLKRQRQGRLDELGWALDQGQPIKTRRDPGEKRLCKNNGD